MKQYAHRLPVPASVLASAAALLWSAAGAAQATVHGEVATPPVSVSGTVQVGPTAPTPPPPQPPPAQPPTVVYVPVPAPAPVQPVYAAPPPPHGEYEHDGFYFRFALGGGGFRSTSTYTSANSSELTMSGSGAGIDLAFGGTVAPGLVVGGDYVFQQAVKPNVKYGTAEAKIDANVNFGVIGPMIDWFPDPMGGFHATATLGLAELTLSDQDGNTKGGNNGFGYSLGAGYDFFVSPQWSLGILGRFFGGSVRKDDSSSTTSEAKTTVSGGALYFTVLYH